MKSLTTTSYAILGLLALQEWSTYELAQQMDRSLRNFWPRAQSKIYDEPKKLVAHGLARARKEPTGRRPRTVYSITPKGRRALGRWLDDAGEGPVLEFEAILKVFFADQGSKDQLLANIRHIRSLADKDEALGQRFAREYLDTGGPFPERLNIIALMVRFLTEQNDAVQRWARWAEEEVAGWRDLSEPPNLEVFEEILKREVGHVDRGRDDRDRSATRGRVGDRERRRPSRRARG